jgi:selT/selW/selH-like putative selenoprotein
LADKILERYAHEIDELILTPSSGGRFEIRRDDVLIFSKAALGRHPDPDEVLAAIESGRPVMR